ncbi:APH(3') family aminoglycoside O-phosphotransferase [Paenibacillus harenae]|uniref:APH(3') family aminoglycoside O-phosphotransferase n=1 Tax=Paenibacillus harenae TaxID=306543 RepID=UPI00278CF56B|nr:APH(3') family aminoglycoside O-phosphotransferase [Paenibacillus harenae]MDQ0061812.1 kanamycin kinase/aminoglycoside 3'-phosphotransferase-2 [Paenibacillus harenae]
MLNNDRDEAALPQPLISLTSDCRWRRITIGMSASRTYRLSRGQEASYLKVQSMEAGGCLLDEKDRIQWLQGKLPVPELLYYDRDESNEYLLLSEVAGLIASDKAHEAMLPQLMAQLAVGLKAVHAVDITDCPFDRTLGKVLEEARQRTEQGLVDEDDFDEERQGMSAAAIYQQLLENRPQAEELVFTHGDYCLPNIILHKGKVSGLIDWGRAGIADKYQDLALAVRSIAHNFGEGHVSAFLEAYGLQEADKAKLEYYKLLDEFF